MAPDAATTGSLKPASAPAELKLAPELAGEDWRRAKGALAIALDPQGNGRPFKWDNPETQVGGVITPEGPPYVVADEICRDYSVSVHGPGIDERTRQGTACRLSADSWEIRPRTTGRKS
ncbi:MAG: hypothetical protein JO048_15765 [Methylobacteriaceae bacterium]|nr:hypothetical protein [Methylobacteriaceae bacterium]